MFHKIKKVMPVGGMKLKVLFDCGTEKIYDVEPLINLIPAFKALRDSPERFGDVSVDVGGYGIVWDDELDLSCDELWENGVISDEDDRFCEELYRKYLADPDKGELVPFEEVAKDCGVDINEL